MFSIICLIFVASTEGWIFEITSCYDSHWPSSSEYLNTSLYNRITYGCSVTANPSESSTELVGFIGEHLHIQGKTNADIEMIIINITPINNVTGIPFHVGTNWLPQLIGVDISGDGITSIGAEELKQFANIIYLHISARNIVSLDGDLFINTPNIEVLLVQYASITNVGHNLLDNLKHLKVVAFAIPCLSYFDTSPEQVEWLKSNLTLNCPPAVTTTEYSPTPTSPVEDCQMRCSLNKDVDVLKDKVDKQDALIADLHEILLNYSDRISDLEKFDAKIVIAADAILD